MVQASKGGTIVEVLVDPEDEEKLSGYNWRVEKNWYIRADTKGKVACSRVTVPQIVTGMNKTTRFSYKNGNFLDCRKENIVQGKVFPSGLLGLTGRLHAKDRDEILSNKVHPYWRPSTRKDCENLPLPCPFVGCKYNTFLDVNENGNIIFNHPQPMSDLDLDKIVFPEDNCILSLIEKHGTLSLHECSKIFNVSKQRVFQILRSALQKIGKENLEILKENIE